MPENKTSVPDQEAGASTTPTPLPPGYLWRLCVALVLLLGGGVCSLFFNGILGSLMILAGIAFGKFSGLADMTSADAGNTPRHNS